MAGYTPARIKREALRAVNRIREADGQEPLAELPCGNPGKAAACPIARALTYGDVGDVALVSRARITYFRTDREIKTPVALARFVCAFDANKLPELICE